MSYPLGVDVGTTYTAAALWRAGGVQTVPLGDRANAVPSVLFIGRDGNLLIGDPAVRQGILEPDRQAREFKRRMGDEVPILVAGQGFTAHELTGQVLRWVLGRVARTQGGAPGHVVLTHPAAWGDYRKGLLVQAAREAGLTDIGLLAEPVAAATWYAAQQRVPPGSLIGIYDFGGGTFDASVVRKTATAMEIFGEPGGDDAIGGIDFDHALFRHVGRAAGVDIGQLDLGDPAMASALAQLFVSVVAAKEALSIEPDVVVPVVLPGLSRQVLVTRAEFEDLIRDRVLGTVGVFGQVVRRAGMEPTKLHAVLLVGGSSRIPLVRQTLAQELGIRVALDAHPKYTVCLGAAIAAAPRLAPARSPVAPMQPRLPQPVPAQQHPAPEPAQPAAAAPAVAAPVDLAFSGLVAPADIHIVLTPPVPAGGDRVAVLRTGDRATGQGSGRARLVAALVVVVIIVVVGGVAVLLTRPHAASPAAANTPVGSSAPPGASAGTLRLTGALATSSGGPATMRAVAARSNGDLVAVGVSLQLKASAWVRRGSGGWTATQPPTDQQATMDDVTAGGPGLVAVGWTGSPRRAAVWTSVDGGTWQLWDPSGDFAAGSGIVELTAVTTGPNGSLLAAGIDQKSGADGQIALYGSPDGRIWSRLTPTGFAGPEVISRLLRTSSGYVAIGSALTGAHQAPALWTSADGLHWQQSAEAPTDASATLFGVVQQNDGSLLVCGSVGTSDQPTVGCWQGSDQRPWQSWTVAGDPTPLYLYGLLRTPAGLLAVGAGRTGTTVDAAAWTLPS